MKFPLGEIDRAYVARILNEYTRWRSSDGYWELVNPLKPNDKRLTDKICALYVKRLGKILLTQHAVSSTSEVEQRLSDVSNLNERFFKKVFRDRDFKLSKAAYNGTWKSPGEESSLVRLVKAGHITMRGEK